MQLADKVLVHQIHPAKITADVTASVVSNMLLWQGRPRAALAVRIMLPVVGSLAVLTLADLDALAQTAPGRYMLAHMPPSAQAVRLAGDALMDLGARRRDLALLRAGAAVIAAGWSHAAWSRTSASVTTATLNDLHRGKRVRADEALRVGARNSKPQISAAAARVGAKRREAESR